MTFIDGLASGLNTTEIIDALMAVERLPQDRVVARRDRTQAQAEQLGEMRASVSSLRNAASDLRRSSGWQRLTGAASSESVEVEATSGGFTGSITFRVDSLATTNVIYSTSTVESLDTVVGTGGTLGQVVESINGNSDLNFVAVAIDTGDGFRLQLAAKEGGAESAIELDTTGFESIGGFTTLTEGADAQITFDGLNPYSVTSASNTFVGIMPGVNLTVSEVSADPVTVTVEHDYEQIADSVQALVEQFNELRTTMGNATRVDPNVEAQVALAFNPDVRRAEQGLVRAFVDPVGASAFEAPGLIGIRIERDGTLTFDRDAFIETASTDINELTRLFAAPAGEGEEPGVLDRLVTAADQAAAFGTGLLSSAEDAAKSRVESFNDQIDAFEARLERKELQLRKTYTNLETALGELTNQSNWLAGQLGSLGTFGGSQS
ncbi:MAG: flagellar filament capping protein FliD [Acidimicrobiia bacterium]|nr:flagellar filament capping protein FliD [Acidimicrobiia bacterium]